jgi:hypothetical protein
MQYNLFDKFLFECISYLEVANHNHSNLVGDALLLVDKNPLNYE